MRGVQRTITSLFLVIILLGGAVAVTSVFLNFDQNKKSSVINSFEDCAKKYPVMESYPEQCATPDGKHFTRELSEEEKQQPLESISTNDPSTWKTYRNLDHDFEFKFPNSWDYRLQNIDGKTTLTLNDIQNTTPEKQMTVEIYPFKTSIETTKNLANDLNPKWENIQIADLQAKRVVHMGCVSEDCENIIFTNNRQIFDFGIENASSKEFQDHLNSITSTFKYLEE